MEISVINKSIKFFIIFFLSINVFAGGDDRDDAYYANLDEELAAFESQIADELNSDALAKELAEFEAEMVRQASELALEKELAAFEAQLEANLTAQEMMAEIEAEMARQAALDAFQAKLAADKTAAA